MKNKFDRDVWHNFCKYISQTNAIDTGVIDMVIKPNRFVAFDEGVFIIVSPSETIKNLINGQFRGKLEILFNAFTGQNIQIKAIIKHGSQAPDNETRENIVSTGVIKKDVKNYVKDLSFEKYSKEFMPANLYFKDFVVGNSNKLAYKASKEFLNSQSQILFLHGDSGLGKTHLLCSIANDGIENNYKVIYMDASQFVEQYTASLGFITSSIGTPKSIDEFVSMLKGVDLLILDDIHGFVGKTASSDTFFNVFNFLIAKNKKIVLASDQPPKTMDGISKRLVSRFSKGLNFKINKPETELVIAFLRKKFVETFSENSEMVISDEVFEILAYHFGADFRTLEGIITKINFVATVNTTNLIDADYLSKHILSDPITKEKVQGAAIQKAVCSLYVVDTKTLTGASRVKTVAEARQVAIYLYRKFMDMSYNQIGKVFGNRDHSTIMHSEKVIKERIKESKEFATIVKKLESEIRSFSRTR